MKKFRIFSGHQRFFLSIAVLPLFFVQSGCPGLGTIFNPPPPPNQSCPVNAPLTLDARKCAVVEKPCNGSTDWQRGDTFSITRTGTTGTPPLSIPAADGLVSNEIRLHDALMRRVCQRPRAASTYTNARAFYEYTYQNNSGVGNYIVTFTNSPAFTVDIGFYDFLHPAGLGEHQPYHHIGYDFTSSFPYFFLDASNIGGSFPPFTYIWRANGEIISTNIVTNELSPTRNTEYTVVVRDGELRQATTGKVVFVTTLEGTPAPGDPTARFLVSPQPILIGQPATLNPSSSIGNIVRWQWDFDWHGEILEPFDMTINGSDGTTVTSWNAVGAKYIRLRVTTAAGNFHETFQKQIVN